MIIHYWMQKVGSTFTAGADFRIGRSFFFFTFEHYNMLNASLTSRSIDSNLVKSPLKIMQQSIRLKIPAGVGYYLTGTGGIVDLNLTLGLSNYFFLSENTEFYSKSDFRPIMRLLISD